MKIMTVPGITKKLVFAPKKIGERYSNIAVDIAVEKHFIKASATEGFINGPSEVVALWTYIYTRH